MQFTLHDGDYGVAEFYRRFGDALPQIVQVTQGYHGEVANDTFDNGQVIRLHTESRQRRVITKTKLHGMPTMLGIPLDYHEVKFCVLDNRGKAGREQLLRDIITHAKKLPLHVQFTKDKSITVGNQTIATNHLPTLELVQTYDEVYMLGNLINYGHMSPAVVPLPLYLTKVRMAIVSGIAAASEARWHKYQRDHDTIAMRIDYQSFYNPDIAEYHETTTTTNESEDIYTYMEPIQYYNLVQLFTPKTPTPTHTKSGHNVPTSNPVYEPLRRPDTVVPQKQTVIVAEKSEDLVPPPLPRRTPATSMSNVQQEQHHRTQYLPPGRAAPAVQNKDKVLLSVDKNLSQTKEQSQHNLDPLLEASVRENKEVVVSKTTPLVSVNEPKPRVPMKTGLVRELKSKLKETAIQQGTYNPSTMNQGNLTEKSKIDLAKSTDGRRNRTTTAARPLPSAPYELLADTSTRMVPDGQEKPPLSSSTKLGSFETSSSITSSISGTEDKGSSAAKTVPSTKDNGSSIIIEEPIKRDNRSSIRSAVRDNRSSLTSTISNTRDEMESSTRDLLIVNGPNDVSKLRLHEVSEYLKLLGLGNYVGAFKQQLIDGELLGELDKDILMKEFGLGMIEAIRLVKFIKTGHVPK